MNKISRQLKYVRKKRAEQIENGQAEYQRLEKIRQSVQQLKNENPHIKQIDVSKQLNLNRSTVHKMWNRLTPYDENSGRGRYIRQKKN